MDSRISKPRKTVDKSGKSRKFLKSKRTQLFAQTRKGDTDIIEKESLCSLALSDAKHDFKTAQMVEEARKVMPTGVAGCIQKDEDAYMKEYLGILRASQDSHPVIALTDTPPYNIPDTYEYRYISRGGELHNSLTTMGLDDVYLVVDTYSPAFASEIASTHEYEPYKHMNFFWVQNKQTLFDPAGKTTDRTKAGVGIFAGNPNAIFCWENNKTPAFYPKWSSNSETVPRNRISNQNELFYSNSEIFQILHSKTDEDYSSQDSKCIMKTAENKLVIMNKELSKITGSMTTAAQYELFKSVKEDINDLIGHMLSQGKFLDRHHCIAKRLGDQGQALSCLKPSFSLFRRENNKVKAIESNGNHAFVTIDRLALGAALIYNVPIIVFCFQHSAMGVFVRKDIIRANPEYEANLLRTLKTRYSLLRNEFESIYDDFKHDIRIYNETAVRLKNALKEVISRKISDEAGYRTFIKDLMSISYQLGLIYSVEIGAIKPDEFIVDIDEINTSGTIVEVINKLNKALDTCRTILKAVEYINDKLVEYDPDADSLNIKAIYKSNLFGRIVGSERLFISNAEGATLFAYILTIYNDIDNIYPKLATAFIETVLNTLANANSIYRDYVINQIKIHKIPTGMRGGGSKSMSAKSKNSSVNDDIYVKSTFMLYVLCRHLNVIIKNKGFDKLMDAYFRYIHDNIATADANINDDTTVGRESILYHVNIMETQIRYSKSLSSIYDSISLDEAKVVEFPLDIINKVNRYITKKKSIVIPPLLLSNTIKKMGQPYTKKMATRKMATRKSKSRKTHISSYISRQTRRPTKTFTRPTRRLSKRSYKTKRNTRLSPRTKKNTRQLTRKTIKTRPTVPDSVFAH